MYEVYSVYMIPSLNCVKKIILQTITVKHNNVFIVKPKFSIHMNSPTCSVTNCHPQGDINTKGYKINISNSHMQC